MEKRYHVTAEKNESQGRGRPSLGLGRERPGTKHLPSGDKVKHSEGFLRLAEDAKARVRETSVEEALGRVSEGGARLVDVREDREWEAGHARGAEHMGRGVIERDIEAAVPDKGAELILYCGGGYRSALAADNLRRMGYTNVYSLAGGWRAWREAGAPVEEGGD